MVDQQECVGLVTVHLHVARMGGFFQFFGFGYVLQGYSTFGNGVQFMQEYVHVELIMHSTNREAFFDITVAY